MREFFDPFGDRMARDIRNSLSSAFISEITGYQPGEIAEVEKFWIAQTQNPIYLDYIEKMKTRYAQAMAFIQNCGCKNMYQKIIVLWNEELFFEMHELLETLYCKTTGPERAALKGLIQAAGVYIHVYRGNQKAARGLASRSRKHLLAGMKQLWFISNLVELIDNLKNPTRPPIKLKSR